MNLTTTYRAQLEALIKQQVKQHEVDAVLRLIEYTKQHPLRKPS